MPKKAAAPLRIAPLLYVIAEPITDPVEQAAIDKVRKQKKRKKGALKAKSNGEDERTGSPPRREK